MVQEVTIFSWIFFYMVVLFWLGGRMVTANLRTVGTMHRSGDVRKSLRLLPQLLRLQPPVAFGTRAIDLHELTIRRRNVFLLWIILGIPIALLIPALGAAAGALSDSTGLPELALDVPLVICLVVASATTVRRMLAYGDRTRS